MSHIPVKFSPPLKIEVYTDGNELEFIGVKNKVYTYNYTKSTTKKGQHLVISEEQLIKFLNNNQIFKQ